MSKSIKVTIIEDHDMTRMGLSFALSNHEAIEVLGTLILLDILTTLILLILQLRQ